jgi:hypothetical protein
LSHSSKDKSLIDSYGQLAIEKTITDAISVLNIENLESQSAKEK